MKTIKLPQPVNIVLSTDDLPRYAFMGNDSVLNILASENVKDIAITRITSFGKKTKEFSFSLGMNIFLVMSDEIEAAFLNYSEAEKACDWFNKNKKTAFTYKLLLKDLREIKFNSSKMEQVKSETKMVSNQSN